MFFNIMKLLHRLLLWMNPLTCSVVITATFAVLVHHHLRYVVNSTEWLLLLPSKMCSCEGHVSKRRSERFQWFSRNVRSTCVKRATHKNSRHLLLISNSEGCWIKGHFQLLHDIEPPRQVEETRRPTIPRENHQRGAFYHVNSLKSLCRALKANFRKE